MLQKYPASYFKDQLHKCHEKGYTIDSVRTHYVGMVTREDDIWGMYNDSVPPTTTLVPGWRGSYGLEEPFLMLLPGKHQTSESDLTKFQMTKAPPYVDKKNILLKDVREKVQAFQTALLGNGSKQQARPQPVTRVREVGEMVEKGEPWWEGVFNFIENMDEEMGREAADLVKHAVPVGAIGANNQLPEVLQLFLSVLYDKKECADEGQLARLKMLLEENWRFNNNTVDDEDEAEYYDATMAVDIDTGEVENIDSEVSFN